MKYVVHLSRSVVVILISLLVVMTVVIGGAYLKGSRLLSVQSDSMAPTFYHGDALLTHKVLLDQLRVGDIVTYHSVDDARMLVSHRISDINYQTGRLLTRGDNLDSNDTPFQFNRVTGRVHVAVPLLGSMLDAFRIPLGLISIVYLPALLVALHETKMLARHYSRT